MSETWESIPVDDIVYWDDELAEFIWVVVWEGENSLEIEEGIWTKTELVEKPWLDVSLPSVVEDDANEEVCNAVVLCE